MRSSQQSLLSAIALGIIATHAQIDTFDGSLSNVTLLEPLTGTITTLPLVREEGYSFKGEYVSTKTLADKQIAYELVLDTAATLAKVVQAVEEEEGNTGMVNTGSRFIKYHGEAFNTMTSIVLTSGHPVFWSDIYSVVDVLGDDILDAPWVEVGYSPFRANVKQWGSPVLELSLKATSGGQPLVIDNTGPLKVHGKHFASALVDFAAGTAQFAYLISALETQLRQSRGRPLVVNDGSDLVFDHGYLSLIVKFHRVADEKWPVFFVADVLRLLSRMRSYFFHQTVFDAFSGTILLTDSTGRDVAVGSIGFYQMLYPPESALGNSSVLISENSTSVNLFNGSSGAQDYSIPADAINLNGTFSEHGTDDLNSTAIQDIT